MVRQSFELTAENAESAEMKGPQKYFLCGLGELCGKKAAGSICLVIAVICIAAGCGQQRKKDVGILARGPDFEKLVVPGDYAAAAIEATGGLQHWAKIQKVQLDCVVTFYAASGGDDSFYLTEQRFYIYPWSNSIEVFGKEPLGAIAWQLSGGQFRALPGDDPSAALRDVSVMGVSCRDYTESVLKIATAPVQFLQTGAVFVKGPAPIKMEGLWYDPIESATADSFQQGPALAQSRPPPADQGAAVKPYWSRVVYCQNRDTSLVDLLWLADIEQGKFLAVRGYDYKEIEKTGILLPTKIEIFRTDARAVSKERIVKIDLK